MDAQPDIVAQLAGALAPKPRPEGFSAFEEYDTVTEWERFADDTNEQACCPHSPAQGRACHLLKLERWTERDLDVLSGDYLRL